MRKVVVFVLALVITSSSFAISKAEAEKLIKDYVAGSNYVSKIHVCENEKYFIGELYLEGYEDIGVTVRNVFVSKKTGDIYPEYAVTKAHCYMYEGK
ncbi:MAG: hypothetical protein GXO22_01800 [Aquificae bacterium]|nr:hypothetical protein [Aquificota bacterium]